MIDTQKIQIQNMRRQGLGYKRIAGSLGLSESTVKSFCLRSKLEACAISSETEAAKQNSICKHCGKPLEHMPKARPKTFCDNKCRYDYWNTCPENRQTAQYVTCAGCGKVFASTGSNRKYCGHPCYISSRYKMGEITNDAGTI